MRWPLLIVGPTRLTSAFICTCDRCTCNHLQCWGVVLQSQAASSHTQTEVSAHTDSQREQLHCAGHEPVCLVPGFVAICMCLIALFNRAAAHVLRAFNSADIGIMNFGSPLDLIACCLMLVAGRPTSQQIFQLSDTAQPDATCNKFLHETWLTMH